MDVSLIITTYNWPEALRLTLGSVLNQSKLPNEVIVADDGSGPETARIVQSVMKKSTLRWCHVRHADTGVRQSRIKNLAVKYSKFPYLVLIDHDVMLHPEFIADHISMSEGGVFLQGKRALLSGPLTQEIIERGSFSLSGIQRGRLKNKKNTYRLPKLGRLFSRTKRFEKSLRGCNLSMYRSDFLGVDGFDETFDLSWGREDSDICYRLFHRGVRVKNLWFLALQYHLHHKVSENWDKERLDRELDQVVQEKRTKAILGFSKLSSEGGIVAESD